MYKIIYVLYLKYAILNASVFVAKLQEIKNQQSKRTFLTFSSTNKLNNDYTLLKNVLQLCASRFMRDNPTALCTLLRLLSLCYDLFMINFTFFLYHISLNQYN